MFSKYVAAGLAAIALALLQASCDTRHVSASQLPNRGPLVTVTVPASMNAGADAIWTVTWTQGTAPFTIAMDMGGGTTENVPAGTPAQSPYTFEFIMLSPSTTDPATNTFTVTVTDAVGLLGTATGSYTVGSPPPSTPVIESAVYTEETRILLVTVSDWIDDSTLVVDVTVPQGLLVDGTTKVASRTGPLTASFLWSAADILAGASGTTTVTVSGPNGGTATTDVQITVPPVTLAPDTLYAVPAPTAAAISEAVTVTVLTGVPAHPLQFVNGIGLTIEADAEKVAWSFNIGTVDQAPFGWYGDGYWTAMAPSGGFLLPPDNFIVATDIGDGRERWDFNCTPIGGSDQTTASGALFNYQFTFLAPGLKTFGFEVVHGVNRTYYSDGSTTEYFWGDTTNHSAGIPNSVEVVE